MKLLGEGVKRFENSKKNNWIIFFLDARNSRRRRWSNFAFPYFAGDVDSNLPTLIKLFLEVVVLCIYLKAFQWANLFNISIKLSTSQAWKRSFCLRRKGICRGSFHSTITTNLIKMMSFWDENMKRKFHSFILKLC